MSNAALDGSLPRAVEGLGSLRLEVHSDAQTLGQSAAKAVAARMRASLADREALRMTVAAAPSQQEMFAALLNEDGIDWQRVTIFHMDEFTGLAPDAPQRFANWLDRHFFRHVPEATIHRIVPEPDPVAEAERYAALLAERPIDIVCLGIGINGHIAFNDPPVADFEDPFDVKLVELDETCRLQQIDDQGFASLDAVPTHALTLTVPQLMRGNELFCVVPGAHKAGAVMRSFTGPVTTACPASILRQHNNCTLYLDSASASQLPPDVLRHAD